MTQSNKKAVQEIIYRYNNYILLPILLYFIVLTIIISAIFFQVSIEPKINNNLRKLGM